MSAGRYTKRPVTIEAMQYTGDNYLELSAWCHYVHKMTGYTQVMDFLHGTWINFGKGDWIIKGTHGEYYPVNELVFTELYEEAQ